MNTRLKKSLIGIGLVAVTALVGTQTWYIYKLTQNLEADKISQSADIAQIPDPVSQPVAMNPQNPWTSMHNEMMNMQAQMDHMIASAFNDFPGQSAGFWQDSNSLTLSEKDGKYIVTAQIPGASKNDIKVNLNGRLLSLSASYSKNSRQTDKDAHVQQQQSMSGSFQQARPPSRPAC